MQLLLIVLLSASARVLMLKQHLESHVILVKESWNTIKTLFTMNKYLMFSSSQQHIQFFLPPAVTSINI